MKQKNLKKLQKVSKTVWIYESPDGGKTVYKRPFGKLEPRIKIDSEDQRRYREILNQISKN